MHNAVNKINTQVPKVELELLDPQKNKPLQMVWGYLFAFLAFVFGVMFIYQLQTSAPENNFYTHPNKGQMCIQVITRAQNLETKEIRDFPTPCDVPEGWEVTPDAGLSVPSPFIE